MFFFFIQFFFSHIKIYCLHLLFVASAGFFGPHVEPLCYVFFFSPGDAGHLLQRQVSRADRGRPVHRGGHPQRVSVKHLWGDVNQQVENKVSDCSVCPAARALLRRSTRYTTRWASTASLRPPSMWQWALCRCARCGSTNVRSIWWHKELRLWPLTPEDRTPAAWRRPLFIRGPINSELLWTSVSGGCVWFKGQTWIIYFLKF